MIENLLAERERTHGSWLDMARTAQRLKSIMHDTKQWNDLDCSQREALEMTMLKIARILCGDAHEKDHWQDAIGYLTLASENLLNHDRK